MNPHAAVRRIFWATLVLNLLVAGIKLVLASFTQSLSLFSDGIHSLLDGMSNVVALVSLKVAERPPDVDHPYGHRKFETIGAMGISGLLCLAAWEILQGAWDRLLHPVELPYYSKSVLVGIVLMILLNSFITSYEKRMGEKLKSKLLLADAEHTRSDAMASILALVAILAAYMKWYWVDTLAAVLIVGLILRAAFRILHDSILTLSDANRLEAKPIQILVEEIGGVKNCHNVRSHGPDGQIHVDLHIVVPATLTAQDTFDIENEVTKRIKKVYPDVSEVTVRHQIHMPSSLKEPSHE